MKPAPTQRRFWLQQSARLGLLGVALQAWPSWAQKMASGQLMSFAQMVEPLTQGARFFRNFVFLV
jgi:hypothetical protein